MKKSLLALAVLGAFAGAASAQSSVTIYGRVDLGVGKRIGTDNKELLQGSAGRIGFRGVEDLGGGLSALFNIEHRFDADTGVVPNASFWHARSVVGLQSSSFGQVTLGREYTAAYSLSQLAADPWGQDTIVNASIDTDVDGDGVLEAGERAGGIIPIVRGFDTVTGGTIAKVRHSNSVRYTFSGSGFQVAAQIAEGDGLQNRPFNVGAAYAGGPVTVGVGYEDPGDAPGAEDDRWITVNAAYNLGAVKLGGFFGTGRDSADIKVRSYMITATAPIGGGELRGALGQRKVDDEKDITLIAVGYHYSLSKRTTIYADVATNRKLDNDKVGYDVGLKHTF